MAKGSKKEDAANQTTTPEPTVIPSINDIEWTDYVLGLLSDDEKISGNPTTDGLRRIFERAMNCLVVGSRSAVVQSPEPSNEKRATVIHTLEYIYNNQMISVDGAADVYWGNCDKIYRNHPVAVAETRAEGRALRRALKLRKVVAAEELAKDIEDHPDGNNVSKISNTQINFIDVLAQRLNINVINLLDKLNIQHTKIYDISHEDAVSIIRELSTYQTDLGSIPDNIKGYNSGWK